MQQLSNKKDQLLMDERTFVASGISIELHIIFMQFCHFFFINYLQFLVI